MNGEEGKEGGKAAAHGDDRREVESTSTLSTTTTGFHHATGFHIHNHGHHHHHHHHSQEGQAEEDEAHRRAQRQPLLHPTERRADESTGDGTTNPRLSVSASSLPLTSAASMQQGDYAAVKPTLTLGRGRFSTRVASDDFAIIEALPLLFTLGVLAMAILFVYAVSAGDCERPEEVEVFAWFWLASVAVMVLLQLLLILCSCRGTIARPQPRLCAVQFLFPLSVFWEIVQLAALVYGCVEFQKVVCGMGMDADPLGYHPDKVVLAFVILGLCLVPFKIAWVLFIVRNCCFHCYAPVRSEHDSYGAFEDLDVDDDDVDDFDSRASFRSFLKCMCCCCVSISKENKRNVWEELADVFMDVFGNREYTYSDMLAGLRLVHLRQKEFRKENCHLYPHEHGNKWRIQDQIAPIHDKALMEELNYFLLHAFSTFTWMMECYLYGPKAVARLCSSMCRTRCAKGLAASQDCTRLARVSFLSQTRVDADDVLALQFENKILKPPFGVFLDHNKKALVVAVRGTFSVSDMVTDGLAHTEDIVLPNGMKTHVHCGILHATLYILEFLRDNNILSQARAKVLQRAGSTPSITAEYSIVTTGHSLGSAIASLLCIFLQFEDLHGFSCAKCFAFSAVPIVNEEVAEWASASITAVTLNHDMVGRLHLYSLAKLKHEIDFAMKHANVKKGIICNPLCCCGACSHTREPLFWDHPDYAPYMASLKLPKPLFIPGRIVHLIKTPRNGISWLLKLFRGRAYRAFSTPRSHFLELSLSGRMAIDHFPRPVNHAVKSALDSAQEDTQAEARTGEQEREGEGVAELSADQRKNNALNSRQGQQGQQAIVAQPIQADAFTIPVFAEAEDGVRTQRRAQRSSITSTSTLSSRTSSLSLPLAPSREHREVLLGESWEEDFTEV